MVTIPTSTLNEILTCIGYPFVKEEDLEITFAEIRDTIIAQALKEYFRWFPITQEYSIGVSGYFAIDFPDDQTFGITEARLITGRGKGAAYGNPLIDERFIRVGGFGRRMYGTRNTYGMETVVPMVRSEAQSLVNYNRAWRIDVDRSQRKVVGFSNVPATLFFRWTKYSLDWSSVAFEQEYDVVKLSQAFILDWFINLRSQITTENMPVSFNIEQFKEKSEKLKEEVYTKWRNYIKPVIIRT